MSGGTIPRPRRTSSGSTSTTCGTRSTGVSRARSFGRYAASATRSRSKLDVHPDPLAPGWLEHAGPRADSPFGWRRGVPDPFAQPHRQDRPGPGRPQPVNVPPALLLQLGKNLSPRIETIVLDGVSTRVYLRSLADRGSPAAYLV